MQTRIRFSQISNDLRLIVHVDMIHFDFIRSYEVDSIMNRDRVDSTFDYLKSFLKRLSRRFRFRLNSNRIVDESSYVLNVFRFVLKLNHNVFDEQSLQKKIFHHVNYFDREFFRLSIST